MDLLKWIKSLDEVLFELMSWLLFWPVTLVRTALRPIAMMRYADAQLARPEDQQYDEALSPPVFLILTLIVAHFAGKALGIRDLIIEDTSGLAALVDNDTSAIAVRLVMFAAFPLVYAALVVATRQRRLDRSSLKLPFYAQCYPAAVFAAVMGAAAEVSFLKLGPAGTSGAIMLAAIGWLIAVETIWLHRAHRFGWASALGLAVLGFAAAGALVVASALVLA